jgi:serine/threonine protein kinase
MKDKPGIPESQLIELSYRVLLALYHIHTYGYGYRDIKPENIMIDDNSIKMVDFGYTQKLRVDISKLNNDSLHSVCQAPQNKSDSAVFDPRCDIWSYGKLLYTVINVRNITHYMNETKIPDFHNRLYSPAFSKRTNMTHGNWAGISEEGKQHILKTLLNRPPASELIKDPWLQPSKKPRKDSRKLSFSNNIRHLLV